MKHYTTIHEAVSDLIKTVSGATYIHRWIGDAETTHGSTWSINPLHISYVGPINTVFSMTRVWEHGSIFEEYIIKLTDDNAEINAYNNGVERIFRINGALNRLDCETGKTEIMDNDDVEDLYDELVGSINNMQWLYKLQRFVNEKWEDVETNE